jgi:hypothetical protein
VMMKSAIAAAALCVVGQAALAQYAPQPQASAVAAAAMPEARKLWFTLDRDSHDAR